MCLPAHWLSQARVEVDDCTVPHQDDTEYFQEGIRGNIWPSKEVSVLWNLMTFEKIHQWISTVTHNKKFWRLFINVYKPFVPNYKLSLTIALNTMSCVLPSFPFGRFSSFQIIFFNKNDLCSTHWYLHVAPMYLENHVSPSRKHPTSARDSNWLF